MGAPISATFDTASLAKALREVATAIAGRNTIPILSNVLFHIHGDTARISATDTDVFVTRSLPVTSDQSARFTIPGKRLADVVGSFVAGSQTRIEVDDGKAMVVSGRARLRFSTLPPDQFPSMPQKAVTSQFEMDAAALRRAIGAVRHAISSEEIRFYLMGVFVHVRENELVFVATDGSRLARHAEPLPADAAGLPDSTIPAGCINTILTAAGAREGAIAITIGDKKVRFEIGDFAMTAKLVEGPFPDYQRVMPSTVASHAVIDRDGMDAALARMSLATNDKVRACRLEVAPNLITAVVTSTEHGESAEEIPCEFTGAPFHIGFNLKFLRDALSALAVDTIDIGFGDPRSPTLFTSAAPGTTKLVLMPMNT